MSDRLGLNEARAIVDAMLDAAAQKGLKFAAAVDGTMLGALGESGGSYQQDEEIGQLGAKLFAGL